MLEAQEEELSLSPKKVGRILTMLGIPDREREENGYAILLDRQTVEMIHRMAHAYGYFEPELYSRQDPHYRCEWCRHFRLVSDSDIKIFEQEEKSRLQRLQREA